MAEPLEIVAAIEALLDPMPTAAGRPQGCVTAGPTHEPIDPVRYLANRSSGKQGHAIAAALARLGADVRARVGAGRFLIPPASTTVHVESARTCWRRWKACFPPTLASSSPRWPTGGPRPRPGRRSRSRRERRRLRCCWSENPDILAGIGHHQLRPRLVVGFAAETGKPDRNARAKLARKGADLIVANDVSHDSGIGPSGVMGGDRNRVRIVSADGVEEWPEMGKDEVAERLAALVARRLA
jgi:phosphopantothenoylcysteine decarboxylase / phosphopantothenate---cysteine ligase